MNWQPGEQQVTGQSMCEEGEMRDDDEHDRGQFTRKPEKKGKRNVMMNIISSRQGCRCCCCRLFIDRFNRFVGPIDHSETPRSSTGRSAEAVVIAHNLRMLRSLKCMAVPWTGGVTWWQLDKLIIN